MKKIVGSLTPKSTYTFLTVPVSPLAGGCKTGDYLLVAYGERGAQLAYVTHADPDRKTLQILRLVNRGKRNAKWKPSKLSRFDARILGKSAPVPQDPPLPSLKFTLGDNKVALVICGYCGNVHSTPGENCPD